MMLLLMHSVLVTGLLLLTIAMAVHTRDALHPGAMVASVWSLVGLCYLVLPHALKQIAVSTLALVVAATLCFVLGSLCVSTSAPAEATQAFRGTPVRGWLYWLAVLGLPAFAWKALEIADSAPFTESTLINLRIALTGERDDLQTYGVLGYLLPVSFSSTLVELSMSRRKGFEPRGWLALLVSLCYAVLATGRTFLFLLLIAIAFVALLQRRIRALTMLWAGLVLIGGGFFGLGWLFNKIGEDSPNVNALSAVDALSLYLLGSLAALDHFLVHGTSSLEWGLNSFRSVMAALSAAGLDVTVVPLVKDYVFVPEPTNVYTVYLPYLQDFGVIGVLLFLALFGWLHALLYRAATTQDPRMAVLYALSMYPLLMQFFQDQYLSLLTTWVTFTLLVLASIRRDNRGWRP
jgi:oligosaccharide repeat unit polymerase